MIKEYLHLFETKSAHDAVYNSENYKEPWVGYIEETMSVSFNHDPSKEYLTAIALEDNSTFTFTMNAKLTTEAVPYMSYSLDGGENWVRTDNVNNESVTVTTPSVNTGDKILWKSEGVQFYVNPDPYPGGKVGSGKFSSTKRFDISGNIMSLLYGDDFIGKTTIKEPIQTGSYCGTFFNLFYNSAIVSASNLSLPATTLAQGCYLNMFLDCTSLTTVPELPATTLAYSCYSGMFSGCTSLTAAPELPATTLAEACYYDMFYGCTSLNYIKAMFTTTPSTSYTAFWVDGVAASGTFVKNSAATWTTTGVHGVPTGWTVETASA